MDSMGNSKKLYKTVNYISNITQDNPYPNIPNEVLAEEFADFFLTKIEKICELYRHCIV